MYCILFAEDWRVDGYRWFQNGIKKIPRSDPIVIKTHFISTSPSGHNKEFKRHSYKLIQDDGNKVLVHYIGDESVACNFPHGNSKSHKIFHRTCKSTLHKLSASHETPEVVYKNLVSQSNCTTSYQPFLLPRNSKQVANMQYRERQNNRLSHDALFNLHEIAYDLGWFVKKINTYPDLLVILGDDRMLNLLNNLIQVDSKLPQLLSYDTTFQLGDFYLSPLLFRHTLFSESPVIPAIFLLHERKFQKVHEEFMKYIADAVPKLVNGEITVPLVIDDEVGLFKAVGKHLTCVKRVMCWNHTINSVKVWLKKHGATTAEIPAYISHVRELLCQTSLFNYEENLKLFQDEWSQSFSTYYVQSVHPKV